MRERDEGEGDIDKWSKIEIEHFDKKGTHSRAQSCKIILYIQKWIYGLGTYNTPFGSTEKISVFPASYLFPACTPISFLCLVTV